MADLALLVGKMIGVFLFKTTILLIVSFCSTPRDTFSKLRPRKASDGDSSSVMLLSAAMISTTDDSYMNSGSPRIWDCKNPESRTFSPAKAPPAKRKR